MFDIKFYDTVVSTNDTVRSLPACTLVWTDNQTAGRGQRGNSWESEPGANLTFSFTIAPSDLRMDRAFVISEAVSLAVSETLGEVGVEARIKWPNDIYVGDRKICGILIENSVRANGYVSLSVVGVGLNVNQRIFTGDAPNPVSLAQLTGADHDRRALLSSFCRRFESLYVMSEADSACYDAIHDRYMGALYRSDGLYPFREAGTYDKPGRLFYARIISVAPDGGITLEEAGGKRSGYYFKEVEFVL